MKPVTITYTFQNQSGPIPLAELDTNFSALSAVANDFGTYSNYLIDISGAANQITVTTPAGTTFGYVAGVGLQVKIANTTTSATVNINVNSLGNQPLVNADNSALLPGQFVAGQILYLMYDGTNFHSIGSNALAGSFTGTLTGYASGPTGPVNYRVANGVCSLVLGLGGSLIGTSNAVTLTMTGLPAVCTPGGGPRVPCMLQNNSFGDILGEAVVGNGGVITFQISTGTSPIQCAANGFTASGTKGLQQGWTITYPLN